MPTYLSAEALAEKKRELEYRKSDLRRQIAEKIASAKELGDLSENFEYQEAKEEQGFNEAAIAQIESQIHDVVVVASSTGGSEVALGATIVVSSPSGERTYAIVGSTEANPMEGRISHESPIGRAFIGRRVGEQVCVQLPSGMVEYTIIEIK